MNNNNKQQIAVIPGLAEYGAVILRDCRQGADSSRGISIRTL